MILDIEYVRSHFPAFSAPSLDGWAFFENAGGSYACQQVIARLTDFYTSTKVQPYAPYPAAAKGGAAMDESYTRLAGYLNVHPDEINFGPSTTQNAYVLANAFSAHWNEGDEIVVTNQDHEANTGAWRRLADRGFVIREWRIDPETGRLDVGELDALLNSRTRLLAFPHCSNIVADINPVADICAKARAAGVRTVVDGVSYAGHGLPDVTALGADVYLFSMYKTFGPHQGVMVVRSALQSELENQSHFFNATELRSKLVPAGPDHAQVAAAAGVAEYFDAVHRHHFNDQDATDAERGRAVHDLFQSHERQLLKMLLEYLKTRDDVRILGPDDAAQRAPTLSIAIDGDPQAIATELSTHKVMCWSGNFYAWRVVEALGLDPETGVLRLSFVHYTSEDDVTQLIGALDAVL